MVDIKRPEFLRDNELPGLLRWNKHTTDNIDLVVAPQLSRCSVSLSANANIASGSNQTVPFNTTVFQAGELSLATTPGTYGILCARAGLVSTSYSAELAASAGGTFRRAYIRLVRTGDNDFSGRQTDTPTAAIAFGAAGHWLVEVLAGDVIEVRVGQDSGGVLALNASGFRTRLDAFYVTLY